MTQTQIVLYTTPEGDIRVDTVLRNETLWLTQDTMAELFGVQRPAITKHLKNIFESGELNESVVGSILEHTTAHGAIKDKTQTKAVKYYNLDAIDSNRRAKEAAEADAEDMKELEEFQKQLQERHKP